ncbi:MAG: hypothetical protein J6A75_04165 [Lachnospiraceae bacterium]|nr:hypothetical protein [Lachnospiraceae bacterium]
MEESRQGLEKEHSILFDTGEIIIKKELVKSVSGIIYQALKIADDKGLSQPEKILYKEYYAFYDTNLRRALSDNSVLLAPGSSVNTFWADTLNQKYKERIKTEIMLHDKIFAHTNGYMGNIAEIERENSVRKNPNNVVNATWMKLNSQKEETLESWMYRNKPNRDTLAILLRYIERLLEVLNQVHEQGYLHLDVKPASVLLLDDEADNHLLLCDYGAAYEKKNLHLLPEIVKNIGYSAPELYSIFGVIGEKKLYNGEGKDINESTDAFAVGGILYTFITGEAYNTTRKYARIDSLVSEKLQLLGIKDGQIREMVSLIKMLLAPVSKQRLADAHEIADCIEGLKWEF